MTTSSNLIGPNGRLFAERQPGKDAVTFRVDNTSEAYYNSPYYVQHKNDVQPIPPPRKNVPTQLQLADFTGPEIITAIQRAGKITFHAVGDTGAAKVNHQQTVERALANEEEVADAMAKDVAAGGPNGPAFFFHLGDVIYNFGEAQYYYDQFYDPYRAYDRPIFAIPGNHDGMVFGQGSSAPQVPTLDAFLSNFCATTTGPSPDGGGLVRSVMPQPGVYFTLDAPYVSIIGLYSNVLDGPGVISSQGGHFNVVGDDQLAFLKSELQAFGAGPQCGKSRSDNSCTSPAAFRGCATCWVQRANRPIWILCARKPDFGRTRCLSGHAHLLPEIYADRGAEQEGDSVHYRGERRICSYAAAKRGGAGADHDRKRYDGDRSHCEIWILDCDVRRGNAVHFVRIACAGRRRGSPGLCLRGLKGGPTDAE